MPTSLSDSLHAKAIAEEQIVSIIDVRTRDEYLQEHIPGSVNIPLDELQKDTERLKNYSPMILSCRSGNRASQAKEMLSSLGFEELYLLEGGLQGWKAAGRSTASLKKGFTIMQQVQMIEGGMVLLGYFVKPLSVLPLLAGAGLFTAGLTNTCMMANLLSKMPWNKAGGKNCSI